MLAKVLHKNYFELFNLKLEYTLDLNLLQQQYLILQRQYHPDNFSLDEKEKAQALVISSQINQAYTCLLQPLSRALYLLDYYGVEVDLVHDTKFTHEFLLTQITWHENIAEAAQEANLDQLIKLETQLKRQIQQMLAEIEQLFSNKQYNELVELVKHLAFYTKLEQMLNELIIQL